jgi:hypothetical protein
MIGPDEDLKAAREAVANFAGTLAAARKVHPSTEYRAMSAPTLVELQERMRFRSIWTPGSSTDTPAGGQDPRSLSRTHSRTSAASSRPRALAKRLRLSNSLAFKRMLTLAPGSP